MLDVCLTALFVGGATMLGGVLGYIVRYQNRKADGAVFSFAAGVMLAASFVELILPVAKNADGTSFIICLFSLIAGGALIHVLQKGISHLEKALPDRRFFAVLTKKEMQGALLFIIAMAIHNLPEGVAAGVAVAPGDLKKALPVTAGIALQNIPEGMIVLPPLIHAGIARRKALLVSVFTGAIEIAGTFLGYFAASVSETVFPFVLCMAGGTMLYIIATEVLDDANSLAGKRLSGYSFLFGVCVMLAMERYV